MKKCPYCAEEIKDEAIKCKHCQSLISEKTNKNNYTENKTAPQKKKIKKSLIFLTIIATALIIGTLVSPNFGFVTIDGGQSIGYDAWAILVYVGGGYIIYKTFKRN